MRTIHTSLSTLLVIGALGCGGGTAPTTGTETTTGAETTGAASSDIEARIREVLAMPHRDEDRPRDQYRHPAETLAFFGLRPDMNVVELAPGRGWYTRVLGPVLREQGSLTVATSDPASPIEYRANSARAMIEMLPQQRDVLGDVNVTVLDTPSRIELGPDGSADLVLTFRNFHGWMGDNSERAVLDAAFRVLRPGGVLGIVEHRARPGTDRETTARTGYVPEQVVIDTAVAAGFRLDGRSEINANPNDTTDHPEGVWSLPPSLRGGDVDRERFVAIGESDRMTLRFVKPE